VQPFNYYIDRGDRTSEETVFLPKSNKIGKQPDISISKNSGFPAHLLQKINRAEVQEWVKAQEWVQVQEISLVETSSSSEAS
jgi:hypothetical protein